MVKLSKTHQGFLDSRKGKLITGLVSLALAYLVFLRATDTGSLQQYAILILLTYIAIRQVVRAVLHKN